MASEARAVLVWMVAGILALGLVTAACGLAVTMYGMGVTVGDYDNDGWPDIFITAVGGNRLLAGSQALPGGCW